MTKKLLFSISLSLLSYPGQDLDWRENREIEGGGDRKGEEEKVGCDEERMGRERKIGWVVVRRGWEGKGGEGRSTLFFISFI
ncbi:unnamed protein product [Prunus armeniaca]|uniref:Uncharacterized protein n=1 Tax=Prunus armeniaca TaxID=36596 RepID=A0A6J5UP21_PRUAR|nr:unnamed protein product [Prunus armeniaca]